MNAPESNPARPRGLVAAVHTPLDARGELNLAAVDRLAARLVRERAAGAFICGTTGEFASLTTKERELIAERWAAACRDDLYLIQHVGGTSLSECRHLAAHARRARAHAIACVGPFFFRPRGAEELADFCARVAGAAPDLPFYYYHLPSLTGVDLPMREFLEEAVDRVPTLAGVKFSALDLLDLGRCAAFAGGRFDVLFGVDEVLLSALVLGARGGVGTTYSFAAPLGRGILEAFTSGDLARALELQRRSMEMVSVLLRHGGHPAMKAVMRRTGIDCGPVRPPLRTLAEVEYTALCRELAAAGFEEYCSRED